MQIFHTVLMVAQVLSAIGVIVLVLLQHGKGADMGAAFGSGSSGSLFGATGSSNFLSRSTAVCATIFLLCTLGLAFYSRAEISSEGKSVMDGIPSGQVEGTAPSAPEKPAATAPAPAADIPK